VLLAVEAAVVTVDVNLILEAQSVGTGVILGVQRCIDDIDLNIIHPEVACSVRGSIVMKLEHTVTLDVGCKFGFRNLK
jgi:hypothetical protein